MLNKSLPALMLSVITVFVMNGCSKPEDTPAGTADTNGICSTISESGLAGKCAVNSHERTIAIVVSTSDEAAWNLCDALASKLKPSTGKLTGQWKLQLFSPYRDDKPIAYCPLY